MNAEGMKAAVLCLAMMTVAGCVCTPPGALVNAPGMDSGNNTTQSESSNARFDSVVVVGFNDSGAFATTGSLTGYSFSHDGGSSFVDAGTLTPVPGGTNVGDPSLAVDRNGRFFFATLATDSTGASFIGVARSTSTSPTVIFAQPFLIPGLDSSGFQDKELIAVDTTGGSFDGNVYVVWTEFVPPTWESRILFSRSADGGAFYDAATQISGGLGAVSGATPFIGPGGALYVAWEDRAGGRIRFRSSDDGGVTWRPEVTAATLTRLRDQVASLACARPALNGEIRVNEFPSMAVDMSAGPNRGDIYIAYAGDPDGNTGSGDASDVFVVKSSDRGVTWSTPVSVHGPSATGGDTTQRDNFMPSLAVDGTGVVGVTFYDRREDASNLAIRLYRATSTDGGGSWVNQSLSCSFGIPPLNPNFDPMIASCYMGDYNGSAGEPSGFSVTWGDNHRTIVTPGFPAGRNDPDVRYIR